MTARKLQRFKDLHAEALFVMPNPWDVGSARLLASLGFPALATTSLGHAASLGRLDQHVTLDEMLTHATSMAAAVDVPLNVDSERCFADDPSGVTTTVGLIAQTGAAGFSIEDYDPANGTVDPINKSVERVGAAAAAANDSRMLLTARAENHLYGLGDLDDTIARLCAFRDAGADVVYAPGLVSLEQIAQVVREVGIPVNVLARPNGPSVAELASVGVRRVSTGGALSMASYGALVRAAQELLDSGMSNYLSGALSGTELEAAFDTTETAEG